MVDHMYSRIYQRRNMESTVRIFCLIFLSAVVSSRPLHTKKVDLTYILDKGFPRWPGFKPLHLEIMTKQLKEENAVEQTDTLETITHFGTHLDAPRHFNEKGWTVEQIPAERLSGPAIVVDVGTHVEKDQNYVVTVGDLTAWEDKHGAIPDNAFVLIRTGLGRFWNDTVKYIGTDTGHFDQIKFPGISLEAAKWLVQERNILGVGLDSLSLDSAAEKHFSAHVTLLGASKVGIENLANLDKLPVKGATLEVYPLKLRGASGAPSQVLAFF